MSSVLTFQDVPASVFVVEEAKDPVHFVTASYATSVEDDKVNYASPSLSSGGVYYFSHRFENHDADNLIPIGGRASYGVALAAKNVQNTLLNFKISASVIGITPNLRVSLHAGYVGSSGSNAGRFWSFGSAGGQSVSHTDSVLLEAITNETVTLDSNIAIWATVTNYSTSAEWFVGSFAASMWTSRLEYPIVRDVNAS